MTLTDTYSKMILIQHEKVKNVLRLLRVKIKIHLKTGTFGKESIFKN